MISAPADGDETTLPREIHDDLPERGALAVTDHPLAVGYRRVRSFLLDLPAQQGAYAGRFYCRESDECFVMVLPPVLTARWRPGLFPDLAGEAQPRGSAWLDYLQRIARTPEAHVAITGHLGGWTVAAASAELNQRLCDALRAHDLQYRPVGGRLHFRAYDLQRWETVRAAVEVVYGPPVVVPRPAPPPTVPHPSTVPHGPQARSPAHPSAAVSAAVPARPRTTPQRGRRGAPASTDGPSLELDLF